MPPLLMWHDQHTLLFCISVVFFIVSLHWNWYKPSRPTWCNGHSVFSYTLRTSRNGFLTSATRGLLHRGPIPNIQHNHWIANLIWMHFCVYLLCFPLFCMWLLKNKIFDTCFVTTDLWHRLIHTHFSAPFILKTFNSKIHIQQK